MNENVKVKIFNSNDISELERDINRFIKNKLVIDIKLAAHRYSCTALVLYKDIQEG